MLLKVFSSRIGSTAHVLEALPCAEPWGPLLIQIDSKGDTPMKTMTCRELGGACDQKLSAETWGEMVEKMTEHVMDEHPDVAKKMEKMHRKTLRSGASK
jgi:predicted small metal-binding protein